ncbi:MAG: RrF2 family transcriptional regulator [Phycisphaerales bacterium]
MITQTGEYALRAVVHLAMRLGDTPASAQDIAEATRVPVGYLQKVLRMLAKAKILTAQRGTRGGFMLAKLPSAISVLDVLEATDSGLSRIERCPLGITGHTHLCALHRLLDEQIASVRKVFASTAVEDLAGDISEVRALCDPLRSGAVGLTVSARDRARAPSPDHGDSDR